MRTSTTDQLDRSQISYKVLPHRRPVFTCEDAARERGVTTAQIAKTMLGIDPDGQVYAILIPGDRKLKIKRVRQEVGGKRVELMPPDEISEKLELVVGAISPVDLIGRAKLYMDRRLINEETVTISAGIPEAGLGLSPQCLADLLQAEIGEFGV